ncbi:hypothetical protein [Prevotella pallens]|uniref:hypothetical protein n=1 Tax=Prevotella pallens TaxID=60133 RepID=UPI001CB3167E|nr:hypothetical protein [Prevotella pallens]MBF1517231.1 hypothetical protein [Prevotella pallens]
MEIKLKAGDSLNIPEGCKAVIKDGIVVFEKEENKEEFKRGDVIVSKMNEILLVDVHSFENCRLKSFVHIRQDGMLSDSSYSLWNENYTWRYATEEEKQLLFDKMKEQGLKWNAEEKKVEKIRWRAKKGEEYRFMNTDFTTVCTTELGDDVDTNRYDALNYFRTKEQAEEAAKRIKEVLCNYHEEIGE